MSPEEIIIVERLRAAAKEHGEVFNLLTVLDDSILLDGAGNKEIIGDKDDLNYLNLAILAAAFARYDRED